jgi:hypothetical protein
MFRDELCPTLRGAAVSIRHTPVCLKAFLLSIEGQGVGFVFYDEDTMIGHQAGLSVRGACGAMFRF